MLSLRLYTRVGAMCLHAAELAVAVAQARSREKASRALQARLMEDHALSGELATYVVDNPPCAVHKHFHHVVVALLGQDCGPVVTELMFNDGGVNPQTLERLARNRYGCRVVVAALRRCGMGCARAAAIRSAVLDMAPLLAAAPMAIYVVQRAVWEARGVAATPWAVELCNLVPRCWTVRDKANLGLLEVLVEADVPGAADRVLETEQQCLFREERCNTLARLLKEKARLPAALLARPGASEVLALMADSFPVRSSQLRRRARVEPCASADAEVEVDEEERAESDAEECDGRRDERRQEEYQQELREERPEEPQEEWRKGASANDASIELGALHRGAEQAEHSTTETSLQGEAACRSSSENSGAEAFVVDVWSEQGRRCSKAGRWAGSEAETSDSDGRAFDSIEDEVFKWAPSNQPAQHNGRHARGNKPPKGARTCRRWDRALPLSNAAERAALVWNLRTFAALLGTRRCESPGIVVGARHFAPRGAASALD